MDIFIYSFENVHIENMTTFYKTIKSLFIEWEI